MKVSTWSTPRQHQGPFLCSSAGRTRWPLAFGRSAQILLFAAAVVLVNVLFLENASPLQGDDISSSRDGSDNPDKPQYVLKRDDFRTSGQEATSAKNLVDYQTTSLNKDRSAKSTNSHSATTTTRPAGTSAKSKMNPAKGNSTFLDQVAKSLIDSFLLKSTTASKQTPGSFIVSSPSRPGQPGCQCELVSIDCLDFISCLSENNDKASALKFLALELQQALQTTASLKGPLDADNGMNPIGKQHEYNTIHAWHSWVEINRLPKFYSRYQTSDFVNHTWYPYCVEHNRSGKNCWFDKVSTYVHATNTGNRLELQARAWFANTYTTTTMRTALQRRIQTLFERFLKTQQQQLQRKREEDNNDDNNETRQRGKSSSQLSPLGHLMIFSHISRLLFHRRSLLEDIYRQHLTTVIPNHNNKTAVEGDPFAIAVHMRRGDSCGNKDVETGAILFESEASPLDSIPQISLVRKCYETHVYLDAIERIREQLQQRPLHVYISTDDPADVIEDIQTNHSRIYYDVVDEWNFLNYTRDTFNYGAVSIEHDQNPKRPILGETAVSDLWLLSHGQAFVGHLGSRFGKVAWLLATSRHGSFVPYLSVDGHSFCCEIDENCGEVRRYITDMENCMTFSHELMNVLGKKEKELYWSKGSLARKAFYRRNKKKEKTKTKSKEIDG